MLHSKSIRIVYFYTITGTNNIVSDNLNIYVGHLYVRADELFTATYEKNIEYLKALSGLATVPLLEFKAMIMWGACSKNISKRFVVKKKHKINF